MDSLEELLLSQPVPEVVPEWLAMILSARLPATDEEYETPLEVPQDAAELGRLAVGEFGI
jgi:hypothetical protein